MLDLELLGPPQQVERLVPDGRGRVLAVEDRVGEQAADELSRFDPAAILDAIARYRVTVFSGTPAMIRRTVLPAGLVAMQVNSRGSAVVR